MTKPQRHLLQGLQEFLVLRKSRIGYRQLRPMATRGITSMVNLEARLVQGIQIDCSESIVLLCLLAGLKDPTGNGYDGNGNTETLLSHLSHHYTDPSQASPGAIVVFNSDRPLAEQHAAQVHTADKDPLLFTHGGAADPSFLKLSQLQPGFPGKTVFLDVSGL